MPSSLLGRRLLGRAVRISVAIASILVGLLIAFGDVFFWSSGNLRGHLYAMLCLLAFGIGSGALFFVRLRGIALGALATHLATTLLALLASRSGADIATLLVGLDVVLAGLVWTTNSQRR